MRLLFRQRFFSWFDSYDIYDENGSTVYTFRDLGITLLVYDYGCGKLLDRVDFLHSGYFELSRK